MHEILIIGVKIVSDNFAARFEHNGKIGRELDTVNRADTVNRWAIDFPADETIATIRVCACANDYIDTCCGGLYVSKDTREDDRPKLL